MEDRDYWCNSSSILITTPTRKQMKRCLTAVTIVHSQTHSYNTSKTAPGISMITRTGDKMKHGI